MRCKQHKKARYTLQVIAVVLVKKMGDAFREYKSGTDDDMTFDDWASIQITPMFKYWYNILHSIKMVFMLVRSFREANLDLLIVALKGIVPLFFTLDHVHYARWVSVFIQDLSTLPQKFPTLYKELAAGYFVVNTKGNAFSKIALD